jgi:membrane-associated phospholipid phosphatase
MFDVLMNVGRYWGPSTVILSLYQGPTVFKPVFLSGFITGILKVLCGRPRPDTKERFGSEFAFLRGLWSDSTQSFPSGHAAVAFAFASAYTGNPELKFMFYSLAVITTISRVYHKRHWISDVIVGSIIGYSIK